MQGSQGPDFSSDNNLTRYLQKANRFPMLSEREEHDLAIKYLNTKDKQAAYIIISSHLKLVIKIAFQFRGYKLPISEIISEGNVGLINALNKFDPHKGYRFSTYAIWWIKAYIQKYVLNSWSMVKVGTTANQKKMFFNLRKAKAMLNIKDDTQMTDDILLQLSEILSVPVDEVVDMNQRMTGRDNSLNVAVEREEGDGKELIDFLADKKPNQEEVFAKKQVSNQRKELFREAFKVLDEREQDILQKRRLSEKPWTLDDLSQVYNISKERVRQIEVASIVKIQKHIGINLELDN